MNDRRADTTRGEGPHHGLGHPTTLAREGRLQSEVQM